MKDYLLDLIEHTHALGVIDLVKIIGTEEETQLASYAEDKSVVVTGTFKTPISDFVGTFGMPNLSKLKTILSFDDYDDKAKICVERQERDGEQVPAFIHFETAIGDFVNDYRLTTKAMIEDKVKTVRFAAPKWDVQFEYCCQYSAFEEAGFC